jgi:hypothetical protein
MAEANQHLPAAGYAANLLPGIAFLLSLILEKHKQAARHEAEFELVRSEFQREFEQCQRELAAEVSKLRTELSLLKDKLDVK